MMSAPYRASIVLFATLAAVAAVDAALATVGISSWLLGLRWLRVHLVTLGVATEAVFGLLPALVARRAGRPAPAFVPGRWLLLNAGIVTLLIGIPLVRSPLIVAGGVMVMLAAVWLGADIDRDARSDRVESCGRPFYLLALAFLVVGALVGTGLWIGWGPLLRIATPKEAHIHANLWGFASLALAGLLVDLLPALTGRSARWPAAASIARWLMLAGALLLLVAPWVGATLPMLVGIALYAAGAVLIFVTFVVPLRRPGGPGAALLLTAYLWILVPASALPVLLLGTATLPTTRVEAVGPSILAYGWLLQALFALLPPAFALAEHRDRGALTLGGTWWSWIALNACTLMLVASVPLARWEAPMQATALVLLALALAPFVRSMLELEPTPKGP